MNGMDSYSHTLVTIPFSHYCERARWALDRSGVHFNEVKFVPIVHVSFVLSYQQKAGMKRSADRTGSSASTPLLISENASTCAGFGDSTDIIRWCDDQRAPADPTESQRLWIKGNADFDTIVRLSHDKLGPAVRALMYNDMLPKFSVYLSVARHNVSWWQTCIWALMWPISRIAFTQMFGLNSKGIQRSRQAVKTVFDEASSMLCRREEEAKGAGIDPRRVYLCDMHRFTAADLTLAALGGLIVGVTHEHGIGAWLPPDTVYDPSLRAFMKELRESKAGKHILRMYKEERRPQGQRETR